MIFEAFKWSVSIASLVGVVLNIRHRRECFAIWGCTNVAWCVVDLYHGIYAQSFLQAVYAMLSVYGWLSWRKAASSC